MSHSLYTMENCLHPFYIPLMKCFQTLDQCLPLVANKHERASAEMDIWEDQLLRLALGFNSMGTFQYLPRVSSTNDLLFLRVLSTDSFLGYLKVNVGTILNLSVFYSLPVSHQTFQSSKERFSDHFFPTIIVLVLC